jgi:hypothetical protein
MNGRRTNTHTSTARIRGGWSWGAAAAGALILLTSGGGAAQARVDPGPLLSTMRHAGSGPQSSDPWSRSAQPTWPSCPLRRVGPTYVRCDDLTGNGVAAPAWILER